MSNHPLTDKIIESIALDAQWAGDIGDTVFRHSDMRKAADWQLKQVIKWLEETECNRYNNVKIIHANDLRAAMRPQQQEES